MPWLNGDISLGDNQIDSTPIVLQGDSQSNAEQKQRAAIARQPILPTTTIPDTAIDNLKIKTTVIEAPQQTALSPDQVSVTRTQQAPVFRPAGADFYVGIPSGTTLTIEPYLPENTLQPTAFVKQVRKIVRNTYLAYDLKQIATRSNLTTVYTGRGLVCTLESDDRVSNTATASCGHSDDYNKAVTAAKPFARLLPNDKKSLVISHLTTAILPSGTEQATMTVGTIDSTLTSQATFIKTPQGTWQKQ